MVRTPVVAKLRINDGHQGQAEAPFMKSLAFQLTAKEARVAPDVVTGMYLNPILFIILLFMLNVYMIV